MRLFVAVCIGLVLSGGYAAAQQPSGEQLFVLPPQGWKIGFHDRQGNVEVTEVLPPDQTVQEWTEMLAVQVVIGKGQKMPQEVLKEQMSDIQKDCTDVGAGAVSLGVENGYDTAIRAIACTRLKKWPKGELGLYKVLRGRDRLYIVSRSWRGEPFEKSQLPLPPETTQAWLAFMQQVVLCDTRDPKRPCPKEGSQPGR